MYQLPLPYARFSRVGVQIQPKSSAAVTATRAVALCASHHSSRQASAEALFCVQRLVQSRDICNLGEFSFRKVNTARRALRRGGV